MDAVESRLGVAVVDAGGAGAVRYLQLVVSGELRRDPVLVEWAWPAGRVVF